MRFCDWRCVIVSRFAAALHGKERVVVSITHPYTALLAPSVVWWWQERHTFHRSWAQVQSDGSDKKREMAKLHRFLKGEISHEVGWTAHSQHFLHCLQTHFFRYDGNHKSSGYANGIRSQEGTRCWCIAWTRRVWERCLENWISGIEHENNSEELARSELEALDQLARSALFLQNHQFQIAVREYQQQARDADSQAVQESSESYKVVMMQEIQGIPNRYEGRMEEHERRVAQMIGSEAREASRGQRNHMLQETWSTSPSRRKIVFFEQKTGAFGAALTRR